LLHSCDNPVPVEDVNIYLYNSLKPCGGAVQTVKTDKNGNFLFDYEATCKDNFNELSLRYDVSFSSGILVSRIRVNENEDLGDVHLKDNGWGVVKIKTNHPYTSSDTLFYNLSGTFGYAGSTYSFKTGPFTDGEIIDTFNRTVEKIHDHSRVTPKNFNYPWGLKSGTIIHYDKHLWGGEEYYLEPCKKYNEIVLDISK